jgi:hypothetical protein
VTYTDPYTPPPEHHPAPGGGQSLADGAAGLALLHIAYARAGIGDWATAHQWVKAMTAEPVAADTGAGLYRGAPAVAFVLRTAGQPVYTGALHTLDEHIAAITCTRLEAAHERIDRGELPALREFDLINGLTGLEWVNAAADQPGPQRPSWCYGAPGLARARHLTAQALDTPNRVADAKATLVACLTDEAQLAQLGDDSLCHGWAGLVHVSRRILADTEPGGEFAEVLSRLEHRWRHRRAQAARKLSEVRGMLEGDAGIALTDLPPGTGWDACLLTVPPTAGPTHSPVSASTHTKEPDDQRHQHPPRGPARADDQQHPHRWSPALRAHRAGVSGRSPAPVRSRGLGRGGVRQQGDHHQARRRPARQLHLRADRGGDDARSARTDHARRALAETSYDRVRVVTGDGAIGDADHAPYDKIIVTELLTGLS